MSTPGATLAVVQAHRRWTGSNRGTSQNSRSAQGLPIMAYCRLLPQPVTLELLKGLEQLIVHGAYSRDSLP